LGIIRNYLNVNSNISDFMSGADIFSVLLAYCALQDCCGLNGSFFVMFVIWASTNAVLFNVLLSFLPNLMDPSLYCTDGYQTFAFIADNVLLLVNSALQLYLVMLAKAVLDEMIPDWNHQMVWGEGLQSSVMQQPLIGQSWSTTTSVQPQSNTRFEAFSGSGQTLGGSRNGSNLV